jgi:hypothetical protein
MKLTAKKGAVKRHGGIEQYLRSELGLRDDVSLQRVKDEGMHGSVSFVWDTPDGDVSCSGYISQPPVATYKMSVWGDDRQALFGCDHDELKRRNKAADDGF